MTSQTYLSQGSGVSVGLGAVEAPWCGRCRVGERYSAVGSRGDCGRITPCHHVSAHWMAGWLASEWIVLHPSPPAAWWPCHWCPNHRSSPARGFASVFNRWKTNQVATRSGLPP